MPKGRKWGSANGAWPKWVVRKRAWSWCPGDIRLKAEMAEEGGDYGLMLEFWVFWVDIVSPWETPWEIRKKRVGWRWREGWGELVCGHPRVARWSRSSAVRKQAVTVFQCFISTCVLDKKIFPETYQSWFRKCAIAAALFKAVFSPKLCQVVIVSCEGKRKARKGNMQGDLQKLTHPAQSLTSHPSQGPRASPYTAIPFP